MYAFNLQTVIQLGLVDVWSAIRKASQLRLGMVIEHFSVAQLENFFNELVTVSSIVMYYL